MCVCADHLVGTVANFSIRHTHIPSSQSVPKVKPYSFAIVSSPSGLRSSSGRCGLTIIGSLAQVSFNEDLKLLLALKEMPKAQSGGATTNEHEKNLHCQLQ